MCHPPRPYSIGRATLQLQIELIHCSPMPAQGTCSVSAVTPVLIRRSRLPLQGTHRQHLILNPAVEQKGASLENQPLRLEARRWRLKSRAPKWKLRVVNLKLRARVLEMEILRYARVSSLSSIQPHWKGSAPKLDGQHPEHRPDAPVATRTTALLLKER